MFSMSAGPLNPETLKAALRGSSAGACVTFEGWVRDENEGRNVTSLEYEGYEAVAVKEGEKILEEAKQKFALLGVRCVHRVGHLAVGDLAVWVGVTAGHRAEAFAACQFIIDEIKHRLPIWKKEHYTDGDSGWVNCQVPAGHAAAREKHF